MEIKNDIIQRPSQNQTVNPNVLQSLRMLHMTLEELESCLKDALESNPFLERDYDREAAIQFEDADYFPRPKRGTGSREVFRPVTDEERELSFTDVLLEQLSEEKLSPSLYQECCYIIWSLNDWGYLEDSLDDLFGPSADIRETAEALRIVQNLEPAGIGARTVEECLLLQITRRQTSGDVSPKEAKDAIRLIMGGLKELAEGDLDALLTLTEGDEERLNRAAELVRELNPIPSRGFSDGRPTQYEIPDAAIRLEGETVVIRLNHTYPQVRLADIGKDLRGEKLDRETEDYIRDKKENAREMIRCVERRESTMEQFLRALVTFQKDFFYADGPIRPMTLRDMAEALHVDISTISRTVQGKSVVWKGKTVPIRSLFSRGYANGEGTATSILVIRNRIAALIAEEDKKNPYSDETMRGLLGREGIVISRRAVAKHRELMGYPSSRERRQRDSS